MTDYGPRVVDDELDALLTGIAAIAIEGPKGVGKTTTAERRARTIYRLDDPGQRAVALDDPMRRVLPRSSRALPRPRRLLSPASAIDPRPA